jgi:hypothetical protein
MTDFDQKIGNGVGRMTDFDQKIGNKSPAII